MVTLATQAVARPWVSPAGNPSSIARVPRATNNGIAVVDFFSGCGGTSAGLRAAGYSIVAALDRDPDAAATFRANFPEAAFIEGDVRRLDETTLDRLLMDDRRGLLVAACAPCQPYSTLRREKRPSMDRSLLLTLLPFVRRHTPDAIVVENVPGLQKVRGASTWNRFRKELSRLGYYQSWGVVDCRDYGVPQRRRRLVLVASFHGPVSLPVPTHGSGRAPHSTVRDWIGMLPEIAAGETHPEDPNHRAGRLGDLNLRRVQATPEGGGRSSWDESLWLDCHKGFEGHQDVYGRLSWDACAPVLTTKCTDITNGRYGHPDQDRAISVREAANIQTFPPDFKFVGSLKSSTRQVGNAVPVLLARRVGEHVAEHLAEYLPSR